MLRANDKMVDLQKIRWALRSKWVDMLNDLLRLHLRLPIAKRKKIYLFIKAWSFLSYRPKKKNSMANANEKSPHILNASSNLLALCFIVLTSLKLLKISSKSIIDELATCAIVIFMLSCLFSFLSIRGNRKNTERFENIADYVFLSGLALLFVTTLLFAFDVIT